MDFSLEKWIFSMNHGGCFGKFGKFENINSLQNLSNMKIIIKS